MTRGEKIAILIDALDNGSILYYETQFGEKEFLFRSGNSYERKGWASALGNVQLKMMDIIENPDEWSIFPNFNMDVDEYPYPWSTKWVEK